MSWETKSSTVFDVSGLTEVMMQKYNGWQGCYYVNSSGNCVAKTCSKCKSIHSSDMFGTDNQTKFGLSTYCRECTPGIASVHTRRTDSQVEIDRNKYRPNGTKKCHMCHSQLSFNMFANSRARIDGLADRCKNCDKEIYKSRTSNGEKYNYDKPYRNAYAKKYKNRMATRTDADLARDRESCHPEGLKTCRECGGSLPLSDFYVKKTVKDGLRDECKPCSTVKSTERRLRPYITYWVSHNIPLVCYVCEAPWDDADHVVSKKRGGSDEPWNRLPLCEPCNSSKYMHPLEDWLRGKYPDIADEVLHRVGVVYGMAY